MAYDKETTERLVKLWTESNTKNVDEVASALSVPKRSVIAKLTSLGLYKKEPYRNKNGEVPVKKEEYLEKIAESLEVNLELLDSLAKANKNVLKMLAEALDPKPQQVDLTEDK